MTTKLSGASLLSGITSGLNSTYSLLSTATSGNVTLESIAAARSNTTTASQMNATFASYIQSNFSNLDKNQDGTLSSIELSNLTNSMATSGFTQAQLTQLGAASGLSGNTLEQVLSHFADIDTNHDGKVTNAEISAFSLKSAEDKKKAEFANKAATNMSTFYGDDDSSAAKSSSLLDYKYLTDGADGSSS